MSLRKQLCRFLGCDEKKKTAKTPWDKYPQYEIGKSDRVSYSFF